MVILRNEDQSARLESSKVMAYGVFLVCLCLFIKNIKVNAPWDALLRIITLFTLLPPPWDKTMVLIASRAPEALFYFPYIDLCLGMGR